MTFFFNIIDTAGVAAYVVWCSKHPEYQAGKTHKRRLFLIDQAETLVREHLVRRSNNPQAMQGGVKLAFKALGFDQTSNARRSPPLLGKQRCIVCPRTADRKTKTRCEECGNACCQDHSKTVCQLCYDDWWLIWWLMMTDLTENIGSDPINDILSTRPYTKNFMRVFRK